MGRFRYDSRWLIRFLLAVVLLGLTSVEFFAIADERSGTQQEEHPGFYDQWLEMKANEQGVIPAGLYQRWSSADRQVFASGLDRKIDNPFESIEYLGPMDIGGRTRAILIDRSDCDRVFAGGISGGLWYSEDRGHSWSPVDDAAVSLAVSDIEQSPFDHDVIYYCTGEARANTAGVSGAGLFKSTDGGLSFSQLLSTSSDPKFDRCWCLEHSRQSSDTVYVGTEWGGLLRTTDGGVTWVGVLGGVAVTDILCFANGEVLATASGEGIYHSDSGAPGTFSLVSSDLFPDEFQKVEIANCEAAVDEVYAAFESPDRNEGAILLCISHDRGQTWTARETPDTGPGYNRYCFTLAVHPSNSQFVFCGGKFPEFSHDGGASWQRARNTHNDYHVLATFHDNTDEFITGNDGGVYEYRWSEPGGATKDLNDGYHVTQFYAGDFGPTGNLVIGGTQDNGTCRIAAGSSRIVNGGDGTFCHISREDANVAYSSAQYGNMFRTENFLADDPIWTSISVSAAMNSEGYKFLNPYEMNHDDAQQLYCRTNEAVWRSLDGGQNWIRLSAGEIDYLYAITCSSEDDPTLYLGGAEATLLRIDHAASATAGSEKDLSDTAPAEVGADFLGTIAIHPLDPGTILVGFMNTEDRARAWKISDADTDSPTWVSVAGNLPATLPVNSLEIDPNEPDLTYFAATDFGLYFTRDGGSNWIKEQRIPNVSIHAIALRDSDRSLFVFTHGRGVWKLTIE